jgi:hypothetical protein
MTFEERVRALAYLGFTEKQTRFLVTVALHGGFCLRRHYAHAAGLAYGAGVRDFLDRLVRRGLARRLDFRRDRGHVYHLCHSALYEAVGQPDEGNRRATSPALVARKLMVLEYVLFRTDGAWYAAEEDKVGLFTEQLGLPRAALPQRALQTHMGRPPTTRHFPERLPIHVGDAPRRITLTFLVTTSSVRPFETFLDRHRRLLEHLALWGIVVIVPRHLDGAPACHAAFETFVRASLLSPVALNPNYRPVVPATFEAFVLSMRYDRFGTFAGLV